MVAWFLRFYILKRPDELPDRLGEVMSFLSMEREASDKRRNFGTLF